MAVAWRNIRIKLIQNSSSQDLWGAMEAIFAVGGDIVFVWDMDTIFAVSGDIVTFVWVMGTECIDEKKWLETAQM